MTTRRSIRSSLSIVVALAAALAGCAAPDADRAAADAAAAKAPPAPATPPPPPAPIPTLPYPDAVLSAANALFTNAKLPDGTAPYTVVIDPLIDGMTGGQTVATQAMNARIAALVSERYAQQYAVGPFSAGTIATKSPLVLVGTFTGVNADRKAEGQREAYRICLALADLKTGTIVGKGLAFAQPDGVDATPTAAFRDAPAWAEDPATQGYIRTCQGTRAGDPIPPLYADRIQAAATIAAAMDAYAARKYTEALALYQRAASTQGGMQLRTYTGLYLTNLRLGKRADATKAFDQIVDQGLDSRKLGVKFLFKPGTTTLAADPKAGPSPYPTWMSSIATRASKRESCLDVVGHTSPTGAEPANETLSLKRAEVVAGQIERSAPALRKKVNAKGAGSKETLVGNGRDDASDALDRRVEFRVVGC